MVCKLSSFQSPNSPNKKLLKTEASNDSIEVDKVPDDTKEQPHSRAQTSEPVPPDGGKTEKDTPKHKKHVTKSVMKMSAVPGSVPYTKMEGPMNRPQVYNSWETVPE